MDNNRAAEKLSAKEAFANVDKVLFFIPLTLVLFLSAMIFLFPEASNSVINWCFSVITGSFGWTMQIFFFLNLIIMCYFIFGKYAKKRFGAEKPEFSTPAWLGMLFTGGTSATVVYWGAIEWFNYLEAPPFGAEPFSAAGMQWATSYSFFNWGPSSLGIYSVIGVVFGFLFFVRRKETNRPSVACESLLKRRTQGWLGKLIDIIYMFGIIGGVGASVGLSTPLLAELLHFLFGIENGLMLNISLIVFWTVLFIIGVYGGLKKTIEKMSNWRIYLLIIGFLAVFIFANKSFIINTFMDSLGTMLNNYLRMNFYSDSLGLDGGFPQNWTIFFYAWWLAYALSTGIYMARISKGRTVRELVVGGSVVTIICIWLHFIILGYYSVDVYQSGIIDVAGIYYANGPYAAIVAIWNTLPLAKVWMIVFSLLILVSLVTVINGTAYTLAIVSTKKLKGTEEPSKLNRVFWAFALGAIGLALIFLGGLKPVQTACVCTGILTLIIIVIILFTFLKYDIHQWDSLMAVQKKELGIVDTEEAEKKPNNNFAGESSQQVASSANILKESE